MTPPCAWRARAGHRSAGHTLLEVLIALPLMALLGAVAVQLLLTMHRRSLHDDGVFAASRELRHGATVLSTELRGLRAADVVAWSDTAIEFEGTVGVGVVCAHDVPGAMVAVAGGAAALVNGMPDPLDVVWNTPPQPGDRLLGWTSGASLTDQPMERALTVRSVGAGRQCLTSPLQTVGAAGGTAIAVVEAAGRALGTGTPVRITRRARYALYRAGDGDWYLGRRSLGPTGWDVIQPVVGPLLAARARGLLIMVRDRDGAPLAARQTAPTTSPATSPPTSPPTSPIVAPARVSVQLRALRRAGRAGVAQPTVDSIAVEVALRADRGGDE